MPGVVQCASKSYSPRCCPIAFEKLKQVEAFPNRRAHHRKKTRETVCPVRQKRLEAQQHIHQQGRVHLPPHRVRVVPQKIAQPERLFDLFEKRLNVPTPLVQVAHRARTPRQIVGDKDHQPFFSLNFDIRFYPSQHHALVLGPRERNELIFEYPLHAKAQIFLHSISHVFLGAAHPPDPSLIQIPKVIEIDVRLVENDDFSGTNACADFACPLVIVMGSGIHDGERGKKTVQIKSEVHFGSGLAAAVFGPVEAVGDQFHDGGIHCVNPDFETSQEPLAFFTCGKTRLNVLKVSENRPEERFDKVGGTNLVCVRKGVARRRGDVEPAQRGSFESKPVANVVETDGMRKLRKEHGRQVAQNAESAGLFLHPSFTSGLIEDTSWYEVEKLLENNNVGTGWGLVHTPTVW